MRILTFIITFVSLFSHFLKVVSSFAGDDAESTGLQSQIPKNLITVITNAEMVIEKAVSIDTILIFCS